MYDKLVHLLESGERKAFVGFLQSRNKRKDTRNVDFFLLPVSQHDKLKQEIGVNAYHVLKNRVSNSLVEFLGNRLLSQEQASMKALKVLMVSRLLFAQNESKDALKLLKKAEQVAFENGNYSVLNEVYKTYIANAQLLTDDETELVLEKLKANFSKQISQHKLDVLFSDVKKAFDKHEFQAESIDVNETVQKSVKRLNINPHILKEPFNTNKLLTILDIYGGLTRNYAGIDQLLLNYFDFTSFSKDDIEEYGPLFYASFYLITNIHFRQLKFEQVVENTTFYTQISTGEVEKKEIGVKMRMIEALTYNFSGEPIRAIELLESISGVSQHQHLVDLSLAMIYFQQNKLEKARRVVMSYSQTDQYYMKKYGREWLMNKNYLEILLAIEKNDLDYAHNLLSNFQRRHRKELEQKRNIRSKEYIRFLNMYLQHPEIVHEKVFVESVYDKLILPQQQEDLFNISLFAWIESKITKKDIYAITLEIVHKKRSTKADL